MCLASFSKSQLWPKAMIHRSLGQRPRIHESNEVHWPKAKFTNVTVSVNMAFGQKMLIRITFLG